jgi:magnesium chelatase family protein
MFSITSSTIIGIQANPVFIETDIAFGMPSFSIVGLPDAAVRESKERIRSAIKNCQLPFPRTRITVNLAPANIKKQGMVHDVAIALSILLAQGEFSPQRINQAVFLGELALDGYVRPIQGCLSTALMMKQEGKTELYLPKDNAQEVMFVPDITIYPYTTLSELISHLKGDTAIAPMQTKKFLCPTKTPTFDFKHIKGQEHAKRGLEIAAAGAHNILLKGPPGTGKTLLARALSSILPPPAYEESLEVTQIHSIAGILPPKNGLITERPFRNPHHSSSAVSLVGGGAWPKPGEVSLAHRGVLFLDELPEFSRHVLEHLRQPLEDGYVTISRAAHSVRFPASFLLIAAMNPCPCGFLTDPKRPCVCTPSATHRYQKKISGPLLDRFDLVIEVPNLDHTKLLATEEGESSLCVRKRVVHAREKQKARFHKTAFLTNNDIPVSKLPTWCELNKETRELIQQALKSNHLSARGYTRVCKVARTIADLENKDGITVEHVAEALQYRLQDF